VSFRENFWPINLSFSDIFTHGRDGKMGKKMGDVGYLSSWS
jgi:hypothetical protein